MAVVETRPVDRFLAAQRAALSATASERVGGRRRWLALTLGLAPMLAVALLPITAVLMVAVAVVAGVTANWVDVVLPATLCVAGAAWAARRSLAASMSPPFGRRRTVVAAAITVGLCVAAATEVVSGSRAPDPVLAMWFLAFAWLFVFLPMAGQRWSGVERAMWIVGPLFTAIVIVVVWTEGFFAYRFDRSVDEFDAYVAELDAGLKYHAGARLGYFEIEARGRLRGCDRAFRIDGWHESDQRWIAHCPDGKPDGRRIRRLTGDWYQFPG